MAGLTETATTVARRRGLLVAAAAVAGMVLVAAPLSSGHVVDQTYCKT